MQTKNVVSFILLKNNTILLEKRKSSKSTEAGKIVIPVGTVEDGENLEEALVREVQEELGIKYIEYKFLCTLSKEYKDYIAQIHYYVITNWRGDIECNEAENLLWVPLSKELKIEVEVDNIAIKELSKTYPF